MDISNAMAVLYWLVMLLSLHTILSCLAIAFELLEDKIPEWLLLAHGFTSLVFIVSVITVGISV
jgi:hypothetical protein